MPVQINEVIIRAVVNENVQNESATSSHARGTAISEEEIADKILAIIREKTER